MQITNELVSIFLQDIETLKTLSSLNLKDLSVTVLLAGICYYFHNKNTKLEEKCDKLTADMLALNATTLTFMTSWKDSIERNTDALNSLISKTR
jgi:hypothetical protein